MAEDVERLVELRQRALRDYLITVPIWMGAMIAKDMVPEQNHGLRALLSLVYLGGMIAWAVPMLRIARLTKLMQADRRLGGVLNDELMQANRAKAALFAVAAVGAVQGVAIALLAFAPRAISALTLAEINLLVGAMAFVGAGFYLDRRAGE
jgi:hypothetical protein